MRLRIFVAIAIAFAPAAPAAARCKTGESARSVAQLFLGLDRHHGQPTISNDEFADFLDREVSSRFPQGLTVIDAQGRWQSHGRIATEPSRILVIVLPGKPDDRQRVSDIASAYNSRFDQEAVLVNFDESCVLFDTARSPAAR